MQERLHAALLPSGEQRSVLDKPFQALHCTREEPKQHGAGVERHERAWLRPLRLLPRLLPWLHLLGRCRLTQQRPDDGGEVCGELAQLISAGGVRAEGAACVVAAVQLLSKSLVVRVVRTGGIRPRRRRVSQNTLVKAGFVQACGAHTAECSSNERSMRTSAAAAGAATTSQATRDTHLRSTATRVNCAWVGAMLSWITHQAGHGVCRGLELLHQAEIPVGLRHGTR
jgi:hypothetical protein